MALCLLVKIISAPDMMTRYYHTGQKVPCISMTLTQTLSELYTGGASGYNNLCSILVP